jgi:hypothetical protein
VIFEGDFKKQMLFKSVDYSVIEKDASEMVCKEGCMAIVEL